MRLGDSGGKLLGALKGLHRCRRDAVLLRPLFSQDVRPGIAADVVGRDPTVPRLVLGEVGGDPADVHAEASHLPQFDPKAQRSWFALGKSPDLKVAQPAAKMRESV